MTGNFSIEKDFVIVLSSEQNERIQTHLNRVNEEWMEWKSSDADLIHQYTKNFNDFREYMRDHVQWHIKIINDKQEQPQLYNEVFEMKMGVNVKDRTIKPKN